ncbi:hypothetical protein BJY04DRAFT_223145 [Aspergillus karnatakaensis]|uniref:uncharacterized protein n=1 Tax=Aspergillus karnatakaensis TaxID=1810916 RepID=UPI003CCE009E
MAPSLPNEIYILIAGFVQSPTDRLNLALCSKQLHQLLIPQAYESILVRSSCIRALSRLAATLYRNKRAAAAVRSLRFSNQNCSHKQKLFIDRELMAEFTGKISSRVEEEEEEEEEDWTDTEEDDGESNMEAQEEWKDAELVNEWRDTLLGRRNEISGEQCDAWMAVLLTLMPKVEILHMSLDQSTKYRQQILQSPHLALGRLFTCLKEVTIPCSKTAVGVDVQEIMPFFKLPVMKKLVSCWVNDFGPPDDQKGRDSSIADLRAQNCNSRTGCQRMILSCSALETFVYEHADGPGGTFMNTPAIYTPLKSHSDTLQKIEIYFTCFDDDLTPLVSSFFGSLVDFFNLRELRLSIMNILDWDLEEGTANNRFTDVLPVSLHSLTLDNFEACPDFPGVVDQLCDLWHHVDDLGELNIRGSFTNGSCGCCPLHGVKFLESKYQAAAALIFAEYECMGIGFSMWCENLDDGDGDWLGEEFYEFHSVMRRRLYE